MTKRSYNIAIAGGDKLLIYTPWLSVKFPVLPEADRVNTDGRKIPTHK
jgi:hypothetical protein